MNKIIIAVFTTFSLLTLAGCSFPLASEEKIETSQLAENQNTTNQKALPNQKQTDNQPFPKQEARVSFPLPNEEVGETIYVTGIARGWYFEGDFPVRLFNVQGKELASKWATAQLDWMTQEFVPFLATLNYSINSPQKAKLVLEEDDPADLPGTEVDSIEIPIELQPGKKSILLYFASSHTPNHIAHCDKVYPAARSVASTPAIARSALEKLLAGPSQKERELGYFSAISEGVKINQLDISGKTARVDFSEEILNMETGATCEKTLIKTQITETLKQFSTVEDVIITIGGKAGQLESPQPVPRN